MISDDETVSDGSKQQDEERFYACDSDGDSGDHTQNGTEHIQYGGDSAQSDSDQEEEMYGDEMHSQGFQQYDLPNQLRSKNAENNFETLVQQEQMPTELGEARKEHGNLTMEDFTLAQQTYSDTEQGEEPMLLCWSNLHLPDTVLQKTCTQADIAEIINACENSGDSSDSSLPRESTQNEPVKETITECVSNVKDMDTVLTVSQGIEGNPTDTVCTLEQSNNAHTEQNAVETSAVCDGSVQTTNARIQNKSTHTEEVHTENQPDTREEESDPVAENKSSLSDAENKPFKCTYCDYSCKGLITIKRHKFFTHKIIHTYKCDFCEFRSAKAFDVKAHVKKMHEGRKPLNLKTLKCDLCEFVTSRPKNLTSHKKIHTEENPCKCEFCDFQTHFPGALNRHKKKHVGEKRYRCDEAKCKFNTLWYMALVSHKRIHEAKNFNCKKCDYTTQQMDELKTHRKIHKGEKRYKCDECEFCSGNSQGLDRHKISHNEDAWFTCDHDQCNYKTSTTKDLKKHKIKHVEIYKCDQCLYKTKDPNGLPKHKLKHADNEWKPYKCDLCKFSTHFSPSLKKHKRRHAGVHAYKCDFSNCKFGAQELAQVREHRRLHTGEKPLTCEMCDFRCASNLRLREHKKKQHTNQQ